MTTPCSGPRGASAQACRPDGQAPEAEGMHESARFDGAILGAGLGGTMLAAILARQGRSVLLLEKGSHPRFAVGEALLPQSTLWMWILAQRFDVPEIQHLTR